MKNFTKIALIVVLVLVVLGSILCTVSLCLGFNYDSFREDVEDGKFAFGPIQKVGNLLWDGGVKWKYDGEDWNSADTDEYSFPCMGDAGDVRVDSLNLDVYYGSVYIVENEKNPDEIRVKIEYRRKNHRRVVEAYKEGLDLHIRETGRKHSRNNDSTRITIAIPGEMKEEPHIMREILLRQDAGEISVDMPLTAEKINITVNAGECEVESKLTALETLKADVGAGEIDFREIEARELFLDAGVGQLDVDRMAADDIKIDCGIGSIDAMVYGRESDYNYDITSNIGEVTIGDESYAGLGNSTNIDNGADKKMQIDCGIGSVEISFDR